VEHKFGRCGVLILFAGFDNRTGHDYAGTTLCRRQVEFIVFLEHIDQEIAHHITTIDIVLNNLRRHIRFSGQRSP